LAPHKSAKVSSIKPSLLAAKQAVDAAQAAELKAVQEREAAEAALQEMKLQHRDKRPRAESTVIDQIQAEECEDDIANPERWEGYTLQMFRALVRKYQTSSTKPIDPGNTDTELPAKGDNHGKRGWRNHSQRGLIGAVRHWADGSPFRVAFMLAKLITYWDGIGAWMKRTVAFAKTLWITQQACPLSSRATATSSRLLKSTNT
jgi:hypothetical protein